MKNYKADVWLKQFPLATLEKKTSGHCWQFVRSIFSAGRVPFLWTLKSLSLSIFGLFCQLQGKVSLVIKSVTSLTATKRRQKSHWRPHALIVFPRQKFNCCIYLPHTIFEKSYRLYRLRRLDFWIVRSTGALQCNAFLQLYSSFTVKSVDKSWM